MNDKLENLYGELKECYEMFFLSYEVGHFPSIQYWKNKCDDVFNKIKYIGATK